jgi:hypothetical protein
MKLIYNPGGFGASRQAHRYDAGHRGHRHRYTRGEKLAILGVLDKLMTDEGMTQAQAGAVLKVDPACLTRWAQKKGDFLENIKETKTKMSDHQGPISVFADIEKDLLNYIEEWRQKGFDVNRFTLLRKAGQLKPEILQKSTFAIKVAISRFLTKNKLTHRVTTHQAQRDPREVEVEAVDFLEYIRPRLADGSRHVDFIINMDQTAVNHAVAANKTIDRVGARTINLRTSANDSKRVTVAVTITASGRRVKSMVVFKGKW